MKLLLILLITVTTTFGQLIDLTPGGFDPEQGLPPAFFQLQEQVFFDEAAHGWFQLPNGQHYFNGWVSMFGELDGGTYFFTNLFVLGDTPSASVWWDFRTLNNYGLTMINVWGRKPDGTSWEHIYGVRRGLQKMSHPVLVTLDGMTFINSIAFYGSDSVRRATRKPQILLRNLVP